jgi:DSF synthase
MLTTEHFSTDNLIQIHSSHTAINPRIEIPSDDVIDQIRAMTGPLPAIGITYDADIKTLWLTIKPEPKPVFTLQLLKSVVAVQKAVRDLFGRDEVYAESPVRFLAYRGEGSFFTLGGDLDFYLDCLAQNDRSSLEEYARVSTEGALLNATGLGGRIITLSTIHAKAVGGGIDAPRSCHIMIAEEHASFVYPEVKFNHFPIAAVPILSRRMGRANTLAMLMSGDEYTAQEMYTRGGVEAVVANGTGEEWIRDYAQKTLPMHGARTALFAAILHGSGNLEEELAYSAKLWTDCMCRLSPPEIYKLQRIAQTQEKMLSRLYRSSAVIA